MGRLAPIGIVGLILADDNVPFDWVAFLLPLVHSESSSFEGFAEPQKIQENREFIRYACTSGSYLTFNYSDPTETRWFEFSNPFLVSEQERKEEILSILDLLDKKNPFFMDGALSTAIQEALLGTPDWIASRMGYRDWFQRTFEEIASTFIQQPQELMMVKDFVRMKVDAGRLIERSSQERMQLTLPTKYDIFISHYHGDAASADAVQHAIHELSPSVRMFRTRASEEEQRLFEKYPKRFLQEARHSKCLVYLATPNSVGRAFIRQELGNNALRPIFTLLIGVSRDDFDKQMRLEMYVAYQRERIYDMQDPEEWRRFIKDLASIVKIDSRGLIPVMPALAPGLPSPRTKQEEGDSYMEWSKKTRGIA